MSLLALADVHHKHRRAQSIIESVGQKKVVLTGDYFDNYGDSPASAEETAIWLKEKVLHNPNITALIGNHDVSYIWNENSNHWCSGYSKEKSDAINRILTPEDKAKFKVYHITEGFAFSHAGITNQIWKVMVQRYTDNPPKKTTLEFFDEVLGAYVKEAIKELDAGREHFLFGAGWDRGGRQSYGGITWVDWSNLSPINGVNQIVGHSHRNIPQILLQRDGGSLSKISIAEHYEREDLRKFVNKQSAVPLPKKKNLSVSYDLDTGLNHYAIVDNGKVEIFDYINQINLRDVSKFAIPSSPLNNLS